MLAVRQYWLLVAVALLAAALAAANIALYKLNQGLGSDNAQRAQYIQQSVQIEPLFQQIVKALAELAVKNNDPTLRELLGSQGITISTQGAAATPAAPK